MAEWIRVPFGVECGRSRDACRWGGYLRREGEVLGVNFGRPIVTSGDFAAQLMEIAQINR